MKELIYKYNNIINFYGQTVNTLTIYTHARRLHASFHNVLGFRLPKAKKGRVSKAIPSKARRCLNPPASASDNSDVPVPSGSTT